MEMLRDLLIRWRKWLKKKKSEVLAQGTRKTMVPLRQKVCPDKGGSLQVKNNDFMFWHGKLELTTENQNGEAQ